MNDRNDDLDGSEAPDLGDLPIFQTPSHSSIQARFAVPAAELPDALTRPPLGTTPARARTPRQTPAASEADLDWALVDEMRKTASERLADVLKGEPANPEREREIGTELIDELLQEHARQSLVSGNKAFTVVDQNRMREAIFNALFRLGRLQPLIDRNDIENIEIFGDTVWLEDITGHLHRGPAVANSDQELVEFLAFIGSRHGNPRPFSEAVPYLNLNLEGGARLAAVAFVTPRPVVVIRIHRLKLVTLSDLVASNTISPNLASFLAAAVRANLSIVVAGAQGAGKTTLVRALCGEIPLREKIGTFETEYELYLHEMPGRDDGRVVPFEARLGSGERLADGRMAGEVTLSELMYYSHRFNLNRQIVGEVRGAEVLPMIQAMQSGAGSLSTTHSRSARQALEKLITCAMEAGSAVTETYASRAIAQSLDLIVYINREDVDNRRHRFVTDVVSVGWSSEGVNFTEVYKPGRDGRAEPHVLPDEYRTLTRHGFDLDGFQRKATM